MPLPVDMRSLHVKLTVITLLIVGVSLFLAHLIDRHYVSELARENLRARAYALLRSVDVRITKDVDLHRDAEGQLALASLYEEQPDLLVLKLYVPSDRPGGAPMVIVTHGEPGELDRADVPSEVRAVFATGHRVSTPGSAASPHRMNLALPVRTGGQVVGALYAEVWTGQFDLLSDHHGRWSLAIRTLAGLLIVVAINGFLYFHVHRPVRRLQSAVTAVARRDLTVSVPVERQDEIGQVGRQFNLMVEQLRLVAEENRRLYEAVREANESLQRRVAEATAELVKRNRELEDLNELLSATQRETARVQRLAVLGQTVATVAHRIGTPLTAISGHIQLLAEDDSLPPAVKGRVTTIMEQIRRLSRVIQDLLTLARKPELIRSEVDVNAVLEQVLNLFRPSVEQQRIELVTEFDDMLAPIIAYGAQIHEAFTNLIDNAVDAMPAGGRLVVRTYQTGEHPPERSVVVEIADTGGGIDPHHLERIFEPFFTTKPAGLGTGLGLAIAQEVVRLHGGRMTVSSEPGKGTRFQIRFPGMGESGP